MSHRDERPQGGELSPEEEAEMNAFAERLSRLLDDDLAAQPMPLELEERLERITREHVSDEARSLPFFVATGVLVVGVAVAGAVVWTPLVLGALALLALSAAAADQALRRLADRTLVQVVRDALARGER